MTERKKYGWTAKGIVGSIFAPIGFIFLALGVLFWFFKIGDGPVDQMIFLYTFGGTGAVFFLVGLGLLMADIRRRALLRRAYESGHYVMAKIVGVNEQRNVNMNGRSPFVVECHYTDPDTGVVHVYYSRYLFVNVDDLLLSGEVPVYFDRMNENVGFVDIDAVLPVVKVHR